MAAVFVHEAIPGGAAIGLPTVANAAATRCCAHANHGFHNDTTPRYDEPAAKLAWTRTVEFFNKYVRG